MAKMIKVEARGEQYLVEESAVDAFFDALIRAGQTETSEAVESGSVESVKSNVSFPEGYSIVGTSTEYLKRDKREYPKGSLVAVRVLDDKSSRYLVGNEFGRSKIAAKIVTLTGDSVADASTHSEADSNFTTHSGDIIIAGEARKCRIAQGKLARGGDATNIHFAKSTKDSEAIREALKANHWRFSANLTRKVADSKSTWYINTLLDLAQVQKMFNK